jgi:hypothetical protein
MCKKALRAQLHYGNNRARLVGFKEHKNYFIFIKLVNPVQFFAIW